MLLGLSCYKVNLTRGDNKVMLKLKLEVLRLFACIISTLTFTLFIDYFYTADRIRYWIGVVLTTLLLHAIWFFFSYLKKISVEDETIKIFNFCKIIVLEMSVSVVITIISVYWAYHTHHAKMNNALNMLKPHGLNKEYIFFVIFLIFYIFLISISFIRIIIKQFFRKVCSKL
jgi:hypothetical protein